MKKLPLVLMFLVLLGCSKDGSDENENNEISQTAITGSIVLPENSFSDVNQFNVKSVINVSNVNDGNYTIDVVADQTNTLYVTDASNKVILMGYYYPNQSDFTINSESTLSAMFMSLPVSQSLTVQGKVDLLNSLKQNPEFNNLKLELEDLIIQGISPLDTTQIDFANSFSEFFQNSINRNASNSENNQPVAIFSSGFGREILFQNPGKAYISYIGIYKDNQQIESIRLDRTRFVPTNLSEIFTGIINNFTGDVDIVEVPYTFPAEDGDYEVRIRTGRQFSGQNDEEAIFALGDNILNIAMDIFLDTISYKEGSNAECRQTMINNFRSFLGTPNDFQNINSVQDILTFTYDKLELFLTSPEIVFNGCNPPNGLTSYIESVKKKMPWLKTIGIIGNTGNLSMTTYQWFNDDPIVDKCYTVLGNNIQECGEIDLSGNWTLIQVGDYVANQYNSTENCASSGNTYYGGFMYYGSPATFSQTTFSLSVGFNQIYNFCSNNECAFPEFCFDNPNQLLLSGNYNSNGDNTYTYLTSNGGGQIYVLNENTINIATNLGTLVYQR